MKSQKGREGDEDADCKSKGRSLRWIIQREQTAKSGAKHLKAVRSEKWQVKSQNFLGTFALHWLFETIQGFGFIVVGVEYGQQLGYHQQVLDLFG